MRVPGVRALRPSIWPSPRDRLGEFQVIVLDTHALVWWVSGESQLSARTGKPIAAEQKRSGQILVCAISAWEIACSFAKAGRS